MLRIFRERWRQGYRTGTFPRTEPVLPARFRGLPLLAQDKCRSGCGDCRDRCPFEAFSLVAGRPAIDLGRCLFCADCPVCPHGALRFSNDYRLAASRRQDLVLDRQECIPSPGTVCSTPACLRDRASTSAG